MIYELKEYGMTCDGCGCYLTLYSMVKCSTEQRIKDEAKECDWIEHEGKHYCPECYIYADGKIVINEEQEVEA